MSTVINYQDNKFRIWNIDQIYDGEINESGYNVHVPNVNDQVTDWDVGVYRVSAVDSETNLSTLELIQRFNNDASNLPDNGSLITALSKYQPNVTSRVFYDNTTSPFTLAIDDRFVSYDANGTSLRLFKGTDIDDETAIISERYNTSNALIGNSVPLVDVYEGEQSGKRPTAISTTEVLQDGDVVTAVIYNSVEGVIGTHPFLVSDAAFILPAEHNTKYLIDITLVSDLLSDTDNLLIENTVNTPISLSSLTARLHYSDGSTQIVNIDGNKCKLHGLTNFNTSLVGTPKNVVLSYYPGVGEPMINGGNGAVKHISKIYKLANVSTDSSIALKIYIIPNYVDLATGYNLTYMLTNVEGDINIDVTNLVTVTQVTGGAYRPVDYGNVQSIRVSLDLNTIGIGGIYAGHVHVQDIDLTLYSPSTTNATSWTIDYVGDGVVRYGLDSQANVINDGDGSVDVSNTMTTVETLLARLYETITPLYDSSTLSEAPLPTHFILNYKGATERLAIADALASIDFAVGTADFVDNETISLTWILDTVDGDRVLGHSPLPVNLIS